MIFTKDDCGVKEAYGMQYVRNILMMEVHKLWKIHKTVKCGCPIFSKYLFVKDLDSEVTF